MRDRKLGEPDGLGKAADSATAPSHPEVDARALSGADGGMYAYKQLGPADIPQFRELLKVFGEAFNEADTYQRATPDDDYLRALLSKRDFVAIAAMDGGEVVGGLAAYVQIGRASCRERVEISVVA